MKAGAMRTLVVWLLLSVAGVAGGEPLFVNADFEAGTLAGWTAKGEAFQHQPTKGDNPRSRNRESSQHQGQFWIGGYERYDGRSGKPGEVFHDGATGTLTSPEFTIKKPYLSFLIGGGHLPGQAGVKLVCDGREVELATGLDSESMLASSHDVSKFLGKSARIVVFDNATGGWGHINVDSFSASDEPLPDARKQFAFTAGIARDGYRDTDYSQPWRPQFHFTSRRNWLNDPNGLVFDGERYHLFFQHNPLATNWGNMTWGHAVSPDMVHWRQLEHALLPYRVDGRVGTIFSGTAVVDHDNSLGVQVGDTKTLCAFFTFAARPKFYQAMAYSTDGGNSWKYWNKGRAVVENQGFDDGERDPKVFWHEPSQRWVMVLWVQRNPGRVRILTSRNLVDWEFASDLMRDWAFECLDLVFLPIDGKAGETKAVIYDASFDYEIGAFDGRAFQTAAGPFTAGGGNFYAAQTFNNSPDGRCVQIGWMRGGPNSAARYGLPYNQQMTFPCELSLKTTDNGVRLFAWPIREIESLQRKSFSRRDVELKPGDNVIAGIDPLDLVDLEIDFAPQQANELVLRFPGVSVNYDAETARLTYTGVREDGEPEITTAFESLSSRGGSVQLRILVDRLSVEIYAFGGERFYAGYYSPRQSDGRQTIEFRGGDGRIKDLIVRELASAWARQHRSK
jgi:sucrose-6-phosphate hydrolase SacC (GH32 family)